jgi:3-hydroxyisobutyrate dehydrogenase
MTSLAFLGLGTMGGGMAARLVGAGFPVAVWNRSAERANRLRELGATVAASPRDAAAGADVVISMVADDEAARSVWLGPAGAVAAARHGAVLIECSTISPAWAEELGREAVTRGCSLIDAPVTGSKTQAAAGELRFLVGGDAGVLERVRPVLAAMGREIVHLGPLGSGARLKLVNNFMCGVQAASLAEAVALIENSGLNRDLALSILQNGAPSSPLVKSVSTRMAAKDYAVNFKLALMRKDLTYAIADARRHGVDLATARAARELFLNAAEWGEADFAAVVEPLRGRRTT